MRAFGNQPDNCRAWFCVMNERLDTGSRGSKSVSEESRQKVSSRRDSLLDDALDTLGYLFHAFGSDAFLLDSDHEPQRFPAQCSDAVRHIENGSAAPSLDIEASAEADRDWGSIRRFFVDRRKREREFVDHTMKDYRGAVEDLVVGLRSICQQGDMTEVTVTESLESIRTIVEAGDIPTIKKALADTVSTINNAFNLQKRQYESQIEVLQSRMSGLRQDLVAAHEEMKQDPLTSLYNRRAFDTAIERFLNVHYMLNQPVSLVMIDVDNFKPINDTLGHAAGDELLRSIANLMLRAFIRKNDLICRYGGDEFAVILPDTPADKSGVSTQRFLDSVRNLSFEEWPDTLEVSCSAGCAEVQDGDSVESLIGRADKALYAAKQRGRNRLVVA